MTTNGIDDPDGTLSPRAPTGVAGLDEVLQGGLPRNRLYLIEGDPGAGKTTLALQFLLAGMADGEPGLYVTLSETKEELTGVAESHGWSLDDLTVCELAPPGERLRPDSQYTLFHPSEVELGETTQVVLDRVEHVRPTRVVFDSLAEMRLLARDSLRFRRQILALKHFFIGRQCTVLFLDDLESRNSESHVHTVVNGVVVLEQLAPLYGPERRRLRVVKLRGVRYRGGFHDFTIRTGGLEVFPRLVAAESREPAPPTAVASGVRELDALLGGGVERGTSTLIMGPAGSGKSAIATSYAVAAIERGERATLYVFDETIGTFLHRSAGLGMSLAPLIDSRRLFVQQIDPAELSPGEFAHRVRTAVTRDGVRVVVLDSLNGYLSAMPDEKLLIPQLHELLVFLNQHGIVTILVCAQNGLIGAGMVNPVDVSYLADTVLLLRHFEAGGEMRRAISVPKRRTGPHERTLREFRLSSGGLQVGEPLREFEGVLTGAPRYLGTTPPWESRTQ